MLSNFHVFPNQHHFWSSAEDDLYFPKFDFHQQNASFLPFHTAACGSSLTSAGLSTSAQPSAFVSTTVKPQMLSELHFIWRTPSS